MAEAEAQAEPGTGSARAERAAALRSKGFPRGLGTLYAVMTATLLVQVFLHAWTFLAEVALRDDVVTLPDGTEPFLMHTYRVAFWVFALAIPLGCVAWMRWLDWSVKNRIVLSEGRFGRTPAGVVWAYFIPVINLFRPLMDLRRLYAAETRFGAQPPGVLVAWWLVTLAHLALMLFDLQPGITPLTAASSALGVLSNALALMVLVLFRRVQAHADTTVHEAGDTSEPHSSTSTPPTSPPTSQGVPA